MKKKDSTSPATKLDIRMIMDELGKLYDANEGWKDEILEKNKEWKDEIIYEFRLISELTRNDALDTHKDRLENHERRITQLEAYGRPTV